MKEPTDVNVTDILLESPRNLLKGKVEVFVAGNGAAVGL
jgi:hypothetical protein